MNGKRMIDDATLTDKLRTYVQWGIQVPLLTSSLYLPVYLGTKPDGTEVYQYFGEVKQGEVIDTSGNIINLAALDAELHRRMSDPRPFRL